MTAAPILFMSDAVIRLAVTGSVLAECQAQVTTAEVAATAGNEAIFTPLDPTGVVKRVGATSYDLHLVAGQDWRTPEGLARFLYDNDGLEATFTIQAFGDTISADTPGMTGICRLVAATYGGASENYATLDVTLPISGAPTLVATYADLLLATPDLIGYWRLGEPSGTVVTDASSGAHNGTYVGTPTLGVAGLVTDADTAVTLNGTSQWASVPTVAVSDEFTLICWVKRGRISTDEVMLNGVTGTASLSFDGATNKVRAVKAGVGIVVLSTTTIATTTAGHMIAWTRNGTSSDKLYIDGADVTGSVAAVATIAATGLWIGSDNGANPLQGTVDEVAVFDRVLTPAEITALYAFHV